MGQKGSHTNELVFRKCLVPKGNVIGGMAMVGQGFNTAVRVLDKGRLTMGVCASGASQKLLDLSVAHVQEMIQSGKSKSDSQAAQFVLADMAADIYAGRQMLYHAARLRDTGHRSRFQHAELTVRWVWSAVRWEEIDQTRFTFAAGDWAFFVSPGK